MKICEQLNQGLSEIRAHIAKSNALLEALKTANTAKEMIEIRKRLNELISSEGPKIATKLAELKELSEAMKALDEDYKDAVATLEDFKVIETNEKGEKYYTADYDGTKEEGGKGIDFTTRKYEMPTLEEIFARMTPEQIKLYYEMKEQGLEPQLQLSPIGKKIRTLAKHLDDRKLRPNQTDIDDKIKDKELLYEPEDYKASSDGNKLITIGGKRKSQWINENRGWIIDIVATVQNIEPNPEITLDKNGEEYTNAQKTALYHEKYTKQGYKGLTYESYLLARMRALRKRKKMDKWTILTDSSLQNTGRVSIANSAYDRVRLFRDRASDQSDDLHWRRAVRVY